MKNVLFALAILLVTCAMTYAQTGRGRPTGIWRVEGVGEQPWTVVLGVDKSGLTGTVSSCASDPRNGILAAEIYEGRINGNTVTFACKSRDSGRTITFTGLINGDEIAFTYKQDVRGGPSPSELPPDANGMFGASSPARLVAKRVKNGGVELAQAVNLVPRGVKVEGRLFLPQEVARVRSVIVLVNSGTSWDGLAASLYPDPELRKLSATLDSSLLLLRITEINQNTRLDFVRDAGAGAADALLALLDRLAVESGHPELKNAALLLWGHSRAGSFAGGFAALHPQRTIAFVRYHSGVGGLLGEINILSHLPALILKAGKDQIVTREDSELVESLWMNARSLGAPWTFAVEPDATHQDPADVKHANELLIPWITTVVRQRVPPDGGPLRVVPAESGWLGNNRTGAFASYGTFSGSQSEASWLPDETTARGWQVVLVSRSAR